MATSMNNSPLPSISILTVARNAENTLARTIQSVLDQHYPKLQYILLDGESSDATPDVIRSFADRLDIWEKIPARGVAQAFNHGLKLCQGDLVGILNADDWFEPDTLMRVAAQADKGNILYGDAAFHDSQGNFRYRFHADHSRLERASSLNHAAVFTRREVFERFGGFDETCSLAMDYAFFLHCMRQGVPFHRIGHVLAHVSLGGISDKHWFRAYREVFRVKRRYRSWPGPLWELMIAAARRIGFGVGYTLGLKRLLALVPSQVDLAGTDDTQR